MDALTFDSLPKSSEPVKLPICSFITEHIFFTCSPIGPNFSNILETSSLSAIFFTISKNACIPSLANDTTSLKLTVLPNTESITLPTSLKAANIPSDNVEKKLFTPKLSFNDVKKSPIDAVTFSNAFAMPFRPPEPMNLPIGDTIALSPFLNKSTAEKTPLNVRLILSAVSSLTFKFFVKV